MGQLSFPVRYPSAGPPRWLDPRLGERPGAAARWAIASRASGRRQSPPTRRSRPCGLDRTYGAVACRLSSGAFDSPALEVEAYQSAWQVIGAAGWPVPAPARRVITPSVCQRGLSATSRLQKLLSVRRSGRRWTTAPPAEVFTSTGAERRATQSGHDMPTCRGNRPSGPQARRAMPGA
jgi:hypothetical protein